MSNSKLELTGSPQEVTVRELLNYTALLSNWLGEGEVITGAAVRLTDKHTEEEIAGVVSGVSNNDSAILFTIDWRHADLDQNLEYRVWVKATIGSQFKEGFIDFKTFYQ